MRHYTQINCWEESWEAKEQTVRLNRLNQKSVKTLPNGFHADGGNLYLRVAGNARSWVFRFAWEGNRHDLGLGSAWLVPLADARRKAAQLRNDVLLGQHPILEKNKEKKVRREQGLQAETETKTLSGFYGEAIDWYVTMRNIRSKSWAKKSRRQMELHVLPSLGHLPISEITPQNVAGVLRPKWHTTSGQRWLTCLRACFLFAKASGWILDKDPTVWKGGLELYLPQQKMNITHRASLPWKDVPALYKTLHDQPASSFRNLLMAVILCVPRVSEFASLKPSDYDRVKRVVVVRQSKTSAEPYEVPVPDEFEDLVATASDAWLFPSKANTPAHGKGVLTFLKQFSDCTVHGFRSSFSTWCADHEKNPETREACLGHTLGTSVMLAYQRSDLLERRRKLLRELQDYVTSLTNS